MVVSADGERWLLLNASPDVRVQLNAFPALSPRGLRGSGVGAVVLTNADLDHCTGLLVLREGGAPPIYCTERTRVALTEGLRILPVLEAYGPVHARVFHPTEPFEPRDREGASLGLSIEPFPVASKPPPYMYGKLPPDDLAGDTVGLSLEAGGRRVVYVPGVRDLDERLAREVSRADLLLIDGTCWTDDELVALGVSTKTARVMGHAPLTGEGGILAFLARFPGVRRALIHVNNSNPVLWEDGPARRALEECGVELTHDGWSAAL